PIWDTSKSPALVLTASCSSLMLENCTGSSQPPKSIVFPPYSEYVSNKGVRFNCANDFPPHSSTSFGRPNLTADTKKGQRFPFKGKSLSWNLKVYRNGFPR